jgi:4-carboxymuconolactone decarboxylase
MSRDAFKKGMKTRRKVLGDEWVDRSIATMTPFNAEFQELITRYAWDEIWNRKGLPHRTRRLLVLAQTLAMGRWEEYALHVRAGLQSGDIDADDLKEVLLQTAIYCGLPTANTGFKEAREVMAQLAGARHGNAGEPGQNGKPDAAMPDSPQRDAKPRDAQKRGGKQRDAEKSNGKKRK